MMTVTLTGMVCVTTGAQHSALKGWHAQVLWGLVGGLHVCDIATRDVWRDRGKRQGESSTFRQTEIIRLTVCVVYINILCVTRCTEPWDSSVGRASD